MWRATSRRVEAVLTAKAELDFRAAAHVFPGCALRRFGRAVATRLPAVPDAVPYNKARGYSADDRPTFRGIVAFYAETGQRAAVEVWAEDATRDLHLALLAAGLVPGAPTVTLHARLGGTAIERSAGVDVLEIDRTDTRYADVLLAGYGTPEGGDFRRMIAIEHETPGLRRYLAKVDGEPAAAAALFTHDGTSLLAGAAILAALPPPRLPDGPHHAPSRGRVGRQRHRRRHRRVRIVEPRQPRAPGFPDHPHPHGLALTRPARTVCGSPTGHPVAPAVIAGTRARLIPLLHCRQLHQHAADRHGPARPSRSAAAQVGKAGSGPPVSTRTSAPRVHLTASSRTWSGPRRRGTSASPPGSGSPSCPVRERTACRRRSAPDG